MEVLMIDKVQRNARRPESDEYGMQMLTRMNERHQTLALWGFSHIDLENAKAVLDVGCGGGRNIKNIMEMAKGAKVFGIDYSEMSVRTSIENNKYAVASGRVSVINGTAEDLPYDENSFNAVTAFETVYYWNDIEKCFESIRKCLKDGGQFLVCNEDCDTKGIEETSKELKMNLYTADDLKKIMENAGFSKAEAFSHENGRWVCAVGTK